MRRQTLDFTYLLILDAELLVDVPEASGFDHLRWILSAEKLTAFGYGVSSPLFECGLSYQVVNVLWFQSKMIYRSNKNECRHNYVM